MAPLIADQDNHTIMAKPRVPLPTEITLHILSFLEDDDVRSFSMVNAAHWHAFRDLPACHRADATMYHRLKDGPRPLLAHLWSRDAAIVPRKGKAPVHKVRTQDWVIFESMPHLLQLLKTRTVEFWKSNVFAALCMHRSSKDPFVCARLDNLIKLMERRYDTTEADVGTQHGPINRWQCERCVSTYAIQLRALRNGQAALVITKIARAEEKYPPILDLECSPCAEPSRCKVRHHPRQRNDRVFLEYGQAYVDSIDTLSSEQDPTERLSLQNEDIINSQAYEKDLWHRFEDVWKGKSWVRQRNPETGRWSHENRGPRRLGRSWML